MNADGIYLATYAALLLNLKLMRINYYYEEGCQVPVSEVRVPFGATIFSPNSCLLLKNDTIGRP